MFVVSDCWIFAVLSDFWIFGLDFGVEYVGSLVVILTFVLECVQKNVQTVNRRQKFISKKQMFLSTSTVFRLGLRVVEG